ncbi:DNA recombination protein RmuC [Aliifodinibius salipaludis]|uniref:DNA recombination protein RmuC n=1 Tax=Fodinibius salipaludis TaxID=2032627 RepID=A0A2A2G833_9BACT|nr:DNA recombination protein RmuC [Aliifodinibius salipaludis]PAU93906.1 DNA recombination protein RmuC [Aliifodinibius salipaludis]
MELISILFIIVGLILGYAIAHFKYKSSRALSREEAEALEQEREQALQTISRLEERNENLSAQLKETGQEEKQAEQRANEAEKQLAELNADYRNLKERLSDQKEEMENLQERFKDEFENLANKILEEKSKKFTEQNKEKLDQLLKPLGEKMEEFKKKVEETHKEDIEGRSSLKQHLEHLKEMNQQMAEEAKDLTRALKGDSKTQGSWGEVILQRILEKSGLTKGREYEIQENHRSEDGRNLYPDVVVYLPDEKRLVIDSKVSLKAYEQFSSAEDEEERQRALKQHVNSLRSHVKGLSSKNYEQLYGGNSPDFVLMFVPIESAFGVALQHDSSLYYDAFDKNIVIVSPSTLLATLATIDSVWKQEYQNKNAQKIAERGGKLYDKFVLFVESLEEIGMRIRQSQESYDQAMNRLKTGRGDLIGQADKLRKLGANNSKKISSNLLDQEDAPDAIGNDDSETESD